MGGWLGPPSPNVFCRRSPTRTPKVGDFAVTRVDIHRGWGGVVNVTIFGLNPGSPGSGRELREAVERSLGAERFRVRLEASS